MHIFLRIHVLPLFFKSLAFTQFLSYLHVSYMKSFPIGCHFQNRNQNWSSISRTKVIQDLAGIHLAETPCRTNFRRCFSIKAAIYAASQRVPGFINISGFWHAIKKISIDLKRPRLNHSSSTNNIAILHKSAFVEHVLASKLSQNRVLRSFARAAGFMNISPLFFTCDLENVNIFEIVMT